MNASKSVVIMVILCIIGPMLVGYCWPTSETETERFAVSDGVDVTDDISTGSIPIYSTYTGLNNNSLFWSSNYQGGSVPDYAGYSSDGQIPAYVSQYDSQNPLYSSSLLFRLSGLDWPSDTLRGTAVPYSADAVFTMSDGTTMDNIVYYPKTGQAVGILSSSMAASSVVNLDGDTLLTVTGSGVSFWAEQRLMIIPSGSVVPGFADLSRGVSILHDEYWYNGFLNDSVEILTSPASDDTSYLFIIGEGANIVRIDVVDGLISVGVGLSDSRIIGSRSVYPFIHIKADIVDDRITISGVVGMDDYLDQTYDLVNSNEFSAYDNEPFAKIGIVPTPGTPWSSEGSYVIKSTSSQIGTRPGLIDSSIDGDAFYPDGDWQVFIRDTSVFGSILTIGGSSYPVSDTGQIVVALADGGTATFQVRDLAIMSVTDAENGRRFYLNGSQIVTSGNQSVIAFGGQWLADIMIFDVKVEPMTLYGWEAGGFGLDIQGFCMVGLMVDILAFAGLTLYGRASGARVLPLLIACVIIGAVFTILLMEGL